MNIFWLILFSLERITSYLGEAKWHRCIFVIILQINTFWFFEGLFRLFILVMCVTLIPILSVNVFYIIYAISSLGLLIALSHLINKRIFKKFEGV